MSKLAKLFDRLMSGQTDASFSFEDLCNLLTQLGYVSRTTKGSHIIFQRDDSFLNLQRGSGGKAKTYQVRQVRSQVKRLDLKP